MRDARRFAQVDVFGAQPLLGNPVAVVLDGDGVDDETMAAFARWTNLSETTFVLTPTTPDADYRLRIFTPGGELPFAGHPTLGSAHAWLEAGGEPARPGRLVQECGAGLVELRADDGGLAFAAPPTVRSGPVDEQTLDRVAAGLGITRDRIVDHQWVDNGPGWLAVRLATAEEVLALQPSAALGDLKVGAVGDHDASSPHRYEVRAFAPGLGVVEDPVTGSLNASVAQWLRHVDDLPEEYTAGQGRCVDRDGVVRIRLDGDDVWVGGATVTGVTGTVVL